MERLTRKSPEFSAEIICKICENPAPRTGPVQLYCPSCSQNKSRQRSLKWAREKGQPRRSDKRKAGHANSSRSSILTPTHAPALAWTVKIAVPYTLAGSKNHVFTNRPEGHLAFRQQANEFKQSVAGAIKRSMRTIVPVQNKVWLSIFIQKPNHRGDAVNFVDAICDGVKVGAGIDDRWFCIRSLDWEIVKSNPMIFISLGQEAVPNVQACSCCGRLLEFSNFSSNKSMRQGVSRECRECMR